jgi:hypothetical protein
MCTRHFGVVEIQNSLNVSFRLQKVVKISCQTRVVNRQGVKFSVLRTENLRVLAKPGFAGGK